MRTIFQDFSNVKKNVISTDSFSDITKTILMAGQAESRTLSNPILLCIDEFIHWLMEKANRAFKLQEKRTQIWVEESFDDLICEVSNPH